MSIASEITRLQNDSSAIASAIATKGVTVPSGSGYDDYAALIGDIPTGSSPNLTTLSVTPTTSAQQITPTSPVDGYDEVNVAAVTASIDSNIAAGNIKKDVTILGVTGTYEGSGNVLVPTPGDYPVVVNAGIGRATTTSLASTGISITIPVSGTYRLKWIATRTNSSSSYTWGTQLYRTRNNVTSAIGTENTSWTSTYMQSNSIDVACEAGDVITIYAQARSTSYIVSAGGLVACVAQKMWTN